MNKEELISGLNDRQKEAVECINGPVLVLAGAGSGKTRILTHRIGYLIEDGVRPWNILAITFTNKAAKEMRERVDRLLDSSAAEQVFVSTFHSMCVRLLRRDIDKLGYERDFTIYDTDDQKTVVRSCIKALKLDTKMYRERALLSLISSQKNIMVDAESYADSASDFYERNAAKVYAEYERQLKANNALDFDDLLIKTVEMFRRFPDVLEQWQERFRYIMVDEYQDTNNVQFELIRLLSAKYGNLCVVGDDDQSIYKFRGANIENILSFEKVFPGARVIKLEQNYRSTKSILNAANEVIKNNKGRKDKRLWTKNEEGRLPVYNEYETAAAEADAIVRQAAEAAKAGISLKDQAILYRTNAQSRLLEEKCVQRSIPYVIVGGVNFYQRKEIKDILSYLRVIANGVDDLACRRIINVPKRGIGQTSVDRVSAYAGTHDISFYDALKVCREINGIGSAAKKIEAFTEMIDKLREEYRTEGSIRALIEAVRDESGYSDELKKDDPISVETRLENIEELINKAVSFEEDNTAEILSIDEFADHNIYGSGETASAAGIDTAEAADAANAAALTADHSAAEATADAESYGNEAAENLADTSSMYAADITGDDPIELLSLFLEDISLVADIDRTDPDEEALTMMTLHAAKGLEFNTVYLCGMEDGLFPSSASINSDDPDGEIEEERRLCYVGFTRARKELYLSSAGERMINGDTRYMKPSRFIDEIPEDAAEKHFRRDRMRSGGRDSFAGFGGYEGRMEYGCAHSDQYSSDRYGGTYNAGFGGRDIYRNDPYAGGSSGYSGGNASYGRDNTADRTYGSYNAFDGSRVGRFGSLDDTPAGRGRKKPASLSSIAGVSKGFGSGNVKQKPEYGVGDRVLHIKFGIGTVTDIADEPKDYKITVNFDELGRKVMYAGFAKLKKI